MNNKGLNVWMAGLFGFGLWADAATSVTWVPTAGGYYEWTNAANWVGGVVPTTTAYQADTRYASATGDQTIHLSTPVSVDAFYPGAGATDSGYAQIFTGSSVSVANNFRVMKGHATLENTVTANGGEAYLGRLGPAYLTIRNGGTFLRPNNLAFYVGFTTAYSSGKVFVEDGGTFSLFGTGAFASGLYIGAKVPGLLWQDGGLVSANNLVQIGYDADGYYRLNGGTLQLAYGGSGAYDRIGSGAGVYGLLHVSGGALSLSNSIDTTGLRLGSGGAPASAAHNDFYLSGGTMNTTGQAIWLADWNVASGSAVAHRSTMTVDGTAAVNVRNILLGSDSCLSVAPKAVLNLNGGLLSLSYYLSRSGTASNQVAVNLNGGVLQWRSSILNGSTQVEPIINIPELTVFGRGGTLDLPSGVGAPLTTPLRTAKGCGVSAITLSNSGNGYFSAPRVTISGGSGSNATAVAVMTKAGTVERVAVTCPGEGYLPSDTLTVQFASAAGSGAAATAALAANGTGVFSKTGAGSLTFQTTNRFDGILESNGDGGYVTVYSNAALPNLVGLILKGGYFQSGAYMETNTAVNNRINPAAWLEVGGGGTMGVFRSGRPPEGIATTQAFARLTAKAGLSLFELRSDARTGTAEVWFNSYSRTGAVVRYTPDASHRFWFSPDVLTDGSAISPSAVSPVVGGFVTTDGLDLVARDPASGYLQTATLSGTAGADSNYLVPAGVSTVSVTEVNSVVFDDVSASAEFYFPSTGMTSVRSGMVLSRRNGDAVQRVGTLAGGTLTTELPGGLVIYERGTTGRSNTSLGARRFLISTTLADPASDKPMAVTLGGGSYTPATGALVRFMNANTFSGGLYLANGGLWYDGDAMLGAAGCPVIASGTCSLTPSGHVLGTATNRPIEIRSGAALQLLSRSGYGALIQGPLSGGGDLLTGEAGLKTYTDLTGDQGAFTGCYYVLGALRALADGSGLSTNANIRFADNSSGFGTLDMSGTFTRPPGTGVGAVCWRNHPSTGGLYGGFSAYGGVLTVNLGGDGRTLEWGSASLPTNAAVYLQNRLATHDLTFLNGMDLKGYQTPQIRVSTDLEKTVHFKGVISDSVGGGTLTKGGQGVLILETTPTFAGRLAITSGKVRLAEGVSLGTLSEVSITGDGKGLELMGTQNVQTVACKITGTGYVTVSDGGTTVLDGTNTYTGVTVVTNGSTLLVNGEHAGGGSYQVTGTLGGTGTIAPAAGSKIVFGAGSRLSPGGPGVIGTLTLGTVETTYAVELSGATLEVDLSAMTSDKVMVAGDLSVGGASAVNLLTTDANLLKSLRGKTIAICQWAGGKVGSFAQKTNVRDWNVVEDLAAKTISLAYASPGTTLLFR